MLRFALIAVTTTSLFACGPGAKIGNGKQGAAEALMAATMPTKAGSDKAATPGLIPDFSWNCPKGGTARFSGFSVSLGTLGATNVSQKFTLKYDNCGLATSSAGTAVYNGDMSVDQSVVTSTSTAGASVDVDQKLVGKVLVQGAFDDFVDANVQQKVAVTALNGTGSVTATLIGTVATSSGSYDFNEAVNVTAGSVTSVVVTH
jgi:hypothetical protein